MDLVANVVPIDLIYGQCLKKMFVYSDAFLGCHNFQYQSLLLSTIILNDTYVSLILVLYALRQALVIDTYNNIHYGIHSYS